MRASDGAQGADVATRAPGPLPPSGSRAAGSYANVVRRTVGYAKVFRERGRRAYSGRIRAPNQEAQGTSNGEMHRDTPYPCAGSGGGNSRLLFRRYPGQLDSSGVVGAERRESSRSDRNADARSRNRDSSAGRRRSRLAAARRDIGRNDQANSHAAPRGDPDRGPRARRCSAPERDAYFDADRDSHTVAVADSNANSRARRHADCDASADHADVSGRSQRVLPRRAYADRRD